MGKTTQNNQKRFLIKGFRAKIESAQVGLEAGQKHILTPTLTRFKT